MVEPRAEPSIQAVYRRAEFSAETIKRVLIHFQHALERLAMNGDETLPGLSRLLDETDVRMQSAARSELERVKLDSLRMARLDRTAKT
jgi:hypothetical protein